MRDQCRAVRNVLLRQAVEVGLQQRRAEAFALELREDGERVDGDGAAFLLVAEGRVGWVVRGQRHVGVGDDGVGRLGGDDVAEQDGFAVRGAAVDGLRGGGGGDVGAFVRGEDAEGELGAFA